MKKLMFVAAVAAAMTGLADVTSANVVGYQNNVLADEGQQFKASCFVTIGAKDAEGNECVRLSDLKVAGYEDTFGSCGGDVWIDMLNIDGSNLYVEGLQKSYYWMDNFFKPAGWYDEEGTALADDESVLGNADEITFQVGEGLCLNTQNGYEGCYLVCAGQVFDKQMNWTLKFEGQQFVANPLPRTITLSELSIAGYEDTFGSCGGDIWIDMLNIDGSNLYVEGLQKSYYWMDNFFKPAGWYDEEGTALADDESPVGNADEIEFVMGEGICFNTQNGYDGCTVVFPAPPALK